MFVIISGPTCSGKTTLADKLVKDHHFNRVVTTTTRSKRSAEKEGVDYHFITAQEFEKRKFLETNEHDGFMYGLEMAELVKHIDGSKRAVLVIEPIGFMKLRRYLQSNNIDHLAVFVDADPKLRVSRLMLRNGNNDRTINRLAYMLEVESKWSQWISDYDMVLENDLDDIDLVAVPILKHVGLKERGAKVA